MKMSLRKEIRRARRGDVRAQRQLGDFYAEENTSHTDYKEAVRWYGFAMKKGDLKAKFEIGRIFDSERIEGERTKAIGVRYFKELAEDGYPTAQYIMGMKYYFGDGVEKDRVLSVKWLRKAEAQGLAEAKRQLENM